MNMLMRPYRKLSAHLTTLPYHAQCFRLVAKIGPVAWLASILVLSCIYGVWLLESVKGTGLRVAFAAVGVAAFLWLSLVWFLTPDASNPGIICNLKPGGGMSVHLEGDMSEIDLAKGAGSALQLAREIGARRIDLYSPLFGRDEKERAWLRWLQKQVKQLAPSAKIEVAHRKPLSWYVSFAYRCQYGKSARATFKNGRVQAACFRITGF
jgi:hypothetical protein